VTCKIFSQNDTTKKYVILTEEQARANIKELLDYDALKLISVKQEQRISNFQKTILVYKDVVIKKDSIIHYKDEIISLQEKIINAKRFLEFHTYAGVETFNLNLDQISGYFRAALEFEKINIGAKVNFRPVDMYDMPNFYYNLNIEYKIF